MYFFYDISFVFGKCDMVVWFVVDEFDFNFVMFMVVFFVVVIVVVGSVRLGVFDVMRFFGDWVFIVDWVCVVEFGWGGLVVLVSDVGYFYCLGIMRYKKGKMVEMLFWVVCWWFRFDLVFEWRGCFFVVEIWLGVVL